MGYRIGPSQSNPLLRSLMYMNLSMMDRDFILAIKITIGFVAKKAAEWESLCRELFFTQDLEEEKLLQYMRRLKVSDSVVLNPGSVANKWGEF